MMNGNRFEFVSAANGATSFRVLDGKTNNEIFSLEIGGRRKDFIRARIKDLFGDISTKFDSKFLETSKSVKVEQNSVYGNGTMTNINSNIGKEFVAPFSWYDDNGVYAMKVSFHDNEASIDFMYQENDSENPSHFYIPYCAEASYFVQYVSAEIELGRLLHNTKNERMGKRVD